jgi:hypothetical protein
VFIFEGFLIIEFNNDFERLHRLSPILLLQYGFQTSKISILIFLNGTLEKVPYHIVQPPENQLPYEAY